MIYLLTGEDEFRKNLFLGRLKEKLLGAKTDAFNYEVFHAEASTMQEIRNSLETLPLTGGEKIVVIEDPELMADDDRQNLISYLQHARDSRVGLIILTRYSRDSKDKFKTTLLKYTKNTDFPRLKPEEISAWITREFKLRNKIINRHSAESIREAAGYDLQRALSLIEQLTVFTTGRDRISEEDVSRFCELPLEGSTFRLLDYINNKNARRSLSILKGLLRTNSSPSQIIGLLNWHIGRLIDVKKAVIGNMPKDEIASSLNIGNYALGKIMVQARNFTLRQLRGHLKSLLGTDLMLKSSGVKGEILIEMLVVKLCT